MRTIEDYLALPYTLGIKKEESGSYYISVKELEGCISVGQTVEERLRKKTR